MRLIDADELKECLDWCEVCRLSIKEIKEDYIDTAPTVEQYYYITGAQWDEFMVEFMKEHKRSHGEWKCTFHSSFPQYEPDEYRCSICNGRGGKLDKFCKHCGADMRGDNNE